MRTEAALTPWEAESKLRDLGDDEEHYSSFPSSELKINGSKNLT